MIIKHNNMNVNGEFCLFGNERTPVNKNTGSGDKISEKMMTPTDTAPQISTDKKKQTRISIVHTNDLHAQLNSLRDAKDDKTYGGLHMLAPAIRKELCKNPENSILLDAGDISTGSPVSNYYHSKPMVDAMNDLHYDAMVLGNHDIEEGRQALKVITQESEFPVLSANFVDKTENGDFANVKPYTFKQVGDIKVGILGVTTVDTMSMLSGEEKKIVQLTSAEEAAKKFIPKMKEEGANLVVLLSHLGVEADKEMAKNVEGIDVIVGGHSHTELEKPVKVGNTYIVQSGSMAKNVGRLDLNVEMKDGKAKIVRAWSKLVPMVEPYYEPDLFTSGIIHKYAQKLAPIMKRKIGEAKGDLAQDDYHTNIGESSLANFVTDLMKEAKDADGAIINASALRANIPEGEVNVGNIYELLPWKTKTSLLEMKGKDVRESVEQIMSSFLNNFAISGFKVEVDSSKPPGQRIVSMQEAGGKPLDPDKTYKIATIEWLAEGSANVDAFTKARSREDDSKDLKEVLIDTIEKKSKIKAETDGRIVDVAKESD